MASAGSVTTAAFIGLGWCTMADMVSLGWVTMAVMASVVATALALVEWAAGAKPRRVVLRLTETPSREGRRHRPHLSPAIPQGGAFSRPQEPLLTWKVELLLGSTVAPTSLPRL